MFFSWPCLAGLCFCRRVFARVFLVRVFLPVSFLSPSGRPPRRTSSRLLRSGKYLVYVILARAWAARRCNRKKTANPTAVQVRAVTSQRESQNAKGVRFSCERGQACAAATAVRALARYDGMLMTCKPPRLRKVHGPIGLAKNQSYAEPSRLRPQTMAWQRVASFSEMGVDGVLGVDVNGSPVALCRLSNEV